MKSLASPKQLLILCSLLSFFSLAVPAQPLVTRSAIALGWAKNQVNAVIFRRNSIASFGSTQFAAFYDESSRVVIASRNRDSRLWTISPTSFRGNTKDAHNSISIAVDGDGFLHLSFDHHNTSLRYARSVKPLTTEFAALESMTGADEKRVTYPEFYNRPDGGLIFMYRDGASGNGRLIINRYDVKARTWTRVQTGLIDGEGKRSAYTQSTVDKNGTIHVSWVWRESPDVASNHDLAYAKSKDGGRTWTKSNGEVYELPITEKNAEIVRVIPQKSELINQTSMTTDGRGNPMIATYWREKDETVPQFRVVSFDGRSWQTSTVSARTAPFSLSGGGTKRIPISRPLIASRGGRTIVVFRDEERGNRVSAAVSKDLKTWKLIDLGPDDVGMWEPTGEVSGRDLYLFVQKVGQGDGEKLEDLAPQMIEIWKVKF